MPRAAAPAAIPAAWITVQARTENFAHSLGIGAAAGAACGVLIVVTVIGRLPFSYSLYRYSPTLNPVDGLGKGV